MGIYTPTIWSFKCWMAFNECHRYTYVIILHSWYEWHRRLPIAYLRIQDTWSQATNLGSPGHCNCTKWRSVEYALKGIRFPAIHPLMAHRLITVGLIATLVDAKIWEISWGTNAENQRRLWNIFAKSSILKTIAPKSKINLQWLSVIENRYDILCLT